MITSVSLSASHDLGHGGPTIEYRIDRSNDSWRIIRTTSRLTPTPGERGFTLGTTVETLSKSDAEVSEFLAKLAAEHRIFEKGGLAWSYPHLHPTFYTITVEDSTGRSHRFEYRIEAGAHLDPEYQALIEELESFFRG